MVRRQKEDTYAQTIRFPVSLEERIAAWAEHHGSVNAAVNKAVLEAVLAHEGEDSTRVHVRRMAPTVQEIAADVAELKEMVKLSNAVAFAGLNALDITVKVSDSDWARVEKLVQAKG